MNLQETKMLLAVINSMFPTWNPPDKVATAKVWQMALEDYLYQDVELALKKFFKADVKGFPPVPGQLISLIVESRTSAEIPDESKAWSLVIEAIGDSCYHSTKCFAELPPLVQRAVGSAYVLQTWAMLDSENLEPVRANFLRSYRSLKEQAIRENANSGKMPEPVEKIEQKMDVSHLLEEKREEIPDEKRDELLRWYDDLKKKYGGGQDGEYRNV